jgi:hypothetical protein
MISRSTPAFSAAAADLRICAARSCGFVAGHAHFALDAVDLVARGGDAALEAFDLAGDLHDFLGLEMEFAHDLAACADFA